VSSSPYYEPECPCPPPGWSKEPAATTPTPVAPPPAGYPGFPPPDCLGCLDRLCVELNGAGQVVNVKYTNDAGLPVTVPDCGPGTTPRTTTAVRTYR
jgi:hypothetical protein